jgi:hypothetical protein
MLERPNATRSGRGSTTLISDKDDPIFAIWQYTLGRAAAFVGREAPVGRGWMNWPGFGQFWTQALRDTLRHEQTGGLATRIEINRTRSRVG